MLMLAGLVMQSSLNAVGLLKRLKRSDRKAQHTQMKLSATPGQNKTAFATSPVPQTIGAPRIVKKSGFSAQGVAKTGWHGTTQRASKISGPPKITVGSSRPGIGQQQILYTEKGSSFQAQPQVVSGTLTKPRKQTLGLVSEQGVPYQVKAREVSGTLRKPTRQPISLRTEQGASYQASSREVMDLRRPQGVQQQQLPKPMMPTKQPIGFRPAVHQIQRRQLQNVPQPRRRLPMQSMPATMQPAALPTNAAS